MGCEEQVNISAKMLKTLTTQLFPPETEGKAEAKASEAEAEEEEEEDDEFDVNAVGSRKFEPHVKARFPEKTFFDESQEEIFVLMMKVRHQR